MTATALHARPSWLRLVGIQFVLVARSGRWIELIGGAFALWVLATLGPTVGDEFEGRAWGQWALYCLVLVAVWPALLWRGEPPRGRQYHWSMPVPRGSHDLARIAAGGLWVLILAAMLAAGVYITLWPIGLIADPQPLSEMIPYTVGLLTLYCVASVAALVSAHPARWFFGVLTAYALVTGPMILYAPVSVIRAWHAPLYGRYGFFWATLGSGSIGERRTESHGSTATMYGGDSVSVTVTVDSTAAKQDRSSGKHVVERIAYPAPHAPWEASGAWLAGSIGVMLVVAGRRRER